MVQIKERMLNFYRENETKVDVGFFIGGFLFDILTLSDIDNLLGVAQQIVYLLILGSFLYFDFLAVQGFFQIPKRLERMWEYRQPIMHFFLGSLLSLYSLFFLKSASFFSSMIFVALLIGMMIANELPRVRKSEVNLRIGLFIICLFSFFSMTIPVILGFVGVVPFTLSIVFTAAVLYGIFALLKRTIQSTKILLKGLVGPGALVLMLFIVFYIAGWIPPVPLSIENMGVYHNIEKIDNDYVAYHEKHPWVFWRTGDEKFRAEPGDTIFFFAQVFSPARFSDEVYLHWYLKDPVKGWISTDRIPMAIKGGKKEGYRGYVTKQNYSSGEWRILVETTDGREIGRTYFEVNKVDTVTPERRWEKDIY